MPIDDLTALGQKMREARKNKELTQQELSDLSHVSVKQIANIEKGKMNPSHLILRALAKVLHISLDTLINPDVSLEDEGVNQMKMLYSSCPPEMRDTLLHHTQETVKELTQQELSDLSHVSVKQIANIEKGKMNPSYLILRALAKVLHISLDTLINPDISLEDEGVNQMKMLYSSCPPEMRDTLLHHTQETVKELTELSEKFEMN